MMPRALPLSLPLSALALTLAACSSSSTSAPAATTATGTTSTTTTTTGQGGAGGSGGASAGGAGGVGQGGAGGATGQGGSAGQGVAGGYLPMPALGALEKGKVNILKPGGKTQCSRGGEYEFFVVPGDPQKVIVEFEGGGACWNEQTCSYAGSIFKETVQEPDFKDDVSKAPGFYNHANPAHPMADWTHVYIPYCTGDIHWGESDTTYGSGQKAFTIHHQGAANVRAALDWAYAQMAAPDKVFVTGCSAGGYGSIWWAPQIQKHWDKAKVWHFADSAAGVITKDFFAESFPAWHAEKSFPSFVGDYAKVTSLPDLYVMIAAFYPQNLYSQYNTRLDENQTFYFQAMGGGDANAWSAEMKSNIAEIEGAAPNFRAFLPDGTQHCILPYDNFYTVDAGGKKLVDWLADVVADKPVENQSCDGCAP
jgi:hypothetical protein